MPLFICTTEKQFILHILLHYDANRITNHSYHIWNSNFILRPEQQLIFTEKKRNRKIKKHPTYSTFKTNNESNTLSTCTQKLLWYYQSTSTNLYSNVRLKNEIKGHRYRRTTVTTSFVTTLSFHYY